MQRIFWSLLVIVLISSCVPNRKYVYLQKNDVKKTDMPRDTVVRKYDLHIQEYKIQPLDILSIRIESLTPEDYNFIAKLYPIIEQSGGGGGGAARNPISGFLVDNNGYIEFPVAGKLKFAGLSVFEAQEMLRKSFQPYLKDPVARVMLMNFRFTVLGEVIGEQLVVSTNTRVTMMEAIGLAGGLTELADRTKIKVIRQVGNQSQVFYVNLLEEELLTADHYYIQQNDIIMVPPLKQRPFRLYWSQNLSLFVSTVSVVLLIVNLSK
jgi:polysaccharide export outer membrane protein